FGPGVFVFRLNDAGTGWGDASVPEADARNQLLGDIADLSGAPLVGFFRGTGDSGSYEFGTETQAADGSWSELGSTWGQTTDFGTADRQSVASDGATPYVAAVAQSASGPHRVVASRYTGGVWEALDSPSDAGADATSAVLQPGSTGGMWLVFGQSSGGTTTYYLDTRSGSGRVYVAAQGADLVDCGPGRDTVVISRIDGYRNCEKVIIRH